MTSLLGDSSACPLFTLRWREASAVPSLQVWSAFCVYLSRHHQRRCRQGQAHELCWYLRSHTCLLYSNTSKVIIRKKTPQAGLFCWYFVVGKCKLDLRKSLGIPRAKSKKLEKCGRVGPDIWHLLASGFDPLHCKQNTKSHAKNTDPKELILPASWFNRRLGL